MSFETYHVDTHSLRVFEKVGFGMWKSPPVGSIWVWSELKGLDYPLNGSRTVC
ncbi:hypothetical protein Hanom_Chr10g00949901 [Helianthus anomalus]